MIPPVAREGGVKRLKALLKPTMNIIRFVFQDSTPCLIDRQLETSSSVMVMVSPHQGFQRIHPALPKGGCKDKVTR
jgi:hypothetical protein